MSLEDLLLIALALRNEQVRFWLEGDTASDVMTASSVLPARTRLEIAVPLADVPRCVAAATALGYGLAWFVPGKKAILGAPDGRQLDVRLLLAGDAGDFTDPRSGEAIAVTVKSASVEGCQFDCLVPG